MSLDLDDRQRAMLREMDVHVWWPKAAVVLVPGQSLPSESLLSKPLPSKPLPGKPLPGETLTGRAAAVAVAVAKPDAKATSVKIQNTTNNVANNVSRTSENPIFDLQSLPKGIATMTWPQLQQAVSGCKACKLCEGRKNTVFGAGQPPAIDSAAPQVDWLIVGDPPDEDEDRSGQPFVGEAGKLLDNMLKAIGQARGRNVYATGVIKCRPPGNRNPEAGELAQCEPYLRRQIELLQPKIILAMGRFAIHSLLQASVPDVQKLPLGKLRGQVHHYISAGRSVPVIATYHPTALLRQLPEKARAWADLCLALEVAGQSALTTPAEDSVGSRVDGGARA